MSSDREQDELTSLYQSISTSNHVSKAKELELNKIFDAFKSLYKSKSVDGYSDASIQSANPPNNAKNI